MRKIKGLIIAFALIVMFLPVRAQAAADNVYIADDADLLSTEEFNDLQEYLESLDSSINYVAVTTNTGEHGADPNTRLYYYYSSKYDHNSDGVAFIIDMYDREIYLSGYGDVQNKIKNADAIDITDNCYSYASDGDYYSCMYYAFRQSDTLVNKGFIFRPMRIIVIFLISIIIGFLGTFIYAMISRSNKGKVAVPSEIIMAGAALTSGAVIYDTKKVLRQSSSGGGSYHSSGGGSYHSSGGGSFHSSGGGHHSSGGGGGHSHSGGGHKF